MKIALTSDLHIGITTAKQISRLIDELLAEKPDLIVLAGDNSGGTYGYKGVKQVVRILRQKSQSVEVIATNSNHDLWYRGKTKPPMSRLYVAEYFRPSIMDFQKNLDAISKIYEDNKIHYLDEDGIYQHPDFMDVVFFGHSGWYNNPNPPTNDQNYLPLGLAGDTNRFLLKKANDSIFNHLEALEFFPDYITRIFVSHFPIFKTAESNDYKGSFEDFCWDANLGKLLHEEHKVKYFLEGHSHTRREGPIVFNCGSDYYNPKYLLINL